MANKRYQFVDEEPAQEPTGRYQFVEDAPEVNPVPSVSKPDNNGAAANILGGALKGVSDIGATLLMPYDYIKDKLTGNDAPNLSSLVTGNKPLSSNEQRRADLKQVFAEYFDPEGMAFKGGSLGTQIAGTGGVAGVLGKGAMLASKVAPQIAPKVAAALGSGGFTVGNAPAVTVAGKVGNAALRTGAGATVGATQAGLVNPNDVGTGAVIGGALPGGVKLAGKVGNVIKNTAAHTLGATTGAGPEAIKQAYLAGKNGATAFKENMTGEVPFDDVVDKARQALANMRQARGEAYRNGMVDISKDNSVLDMKPILNEVGKIRSMGSYKGQQINKNASGTVDEIAAKVDEWANLNPADYHTPEGLDALKQSIGDIRDATQPGTPARVAADRVYNSVKNQIAMQAPTYSKVMKDYQQASETLKEIEKGLSLGEKASRDTAIRKLQSLMRNNAQTNYGNRLNLAATLEQQGGADLFPSIAGQAMNSWTPRGMVGAMEKAGIPLMTYFNPAVAAVAPFTSPRMVGSALYGLGRLNGQAGNAATSVTKPLGLLNTPLLESNLSRTLPVFAIPAFTSASP